MARRKSTPLRTALSRLFPAALLQRVVRETGTRSPPPLCWLASLLPECDGAAAVGQFLLQPLHPGVYLLSAGVVGSGVGQAQSLRRRFGGGAGRDPGRALRGFHHCPAPRRLGRLLAGMPYQPHLGRGEAAHCPQCPRHGPPSHQDHLGTGGHDGAVLRAGRWVKGRLLLFDLGYFRYSLFAAIAQQGGFFLTRLKDNANPIVRCVHRSHRGRAVAVEGMKLRDLRSRLPRAVLDAEAEICFQRRQYAGRRSTATMRVRIVGLWDEGRGVYHWYITNLPVAKVKAEEIGKLYGRPLDNRVAVPRVEEQLPVGIHSEPQEPCGRGLSVCILVDLVGQSSTPACHSSLGIFGRSSDPDRTLGPSVCQCRSRSAGSGAGSRRHGTNSRTAPTEIFSCRSARPKREPTPTP